MSTRKQQSRGSSGSEKLTRSQRRADERRKQKLTSIGMMAAGALIIAAVLIFIVNDTPPDSVLIDEAAETIRLSAPRQHTLVDDNAVGNPNAPVVLMEFSDFQCSHCANFFNEKEQLLIDSYVATGQVYFIYRSFGANSYESGQAAEAAYCAGDQGKFWEMHDIIFTNYGPPPTDIRLFAMAEKIGLDIDSFENCLESNKYQDRVRQDFVDAAAAEISGTPSFLINGELEIIGNEPLASFQEKIEAALAAAGN